ncbi:hypothetical protein J437_LFUL011229 [Ladona fulva]|uniref:RNA helicase n=1 Tax=Ladona fulva TaxID=123851 RepID=A0A8K0KH98_LADFU|nr:hypothetical protein J437_LFUL011229 [Ladona fulva]
MPESESFIVGFGDPDEADDIDKKNAHSSKSKKTTGKKVGGFQGMGLCFPLLKGIQKRGYKIPTPIQRKTIPLVLEGRDVVAMARTGSGKTACFLIPLFEKLKAHSAKTGARALILSPTRELAFQTHRFIKELGKFMDLKSALILGGDSMEQQFDALHGSPDIIVATPGRFLHVCVEMDLKLNSMEYVVFDEADRLFEMGFGEQLQEILARLPDSRQTVLFSATLPKLLVEFARAGLTDPVLLRLDVDTKIPETLSLGFIFCSSEEKESALLALLHFAVPEDSKTAIFVPTKHHVDYLNLLLTNAGFLATYVYSDLDPSARKINAAKFLTGKAKILVVTDVAARGIDIPSLDTVINFNFPPKPKLFVHRVGRCARAGRSGTAFSLVSKEEQPYLLDLHLFLGRPLVLAPLQSTSSNDKWESGTMGRVPRELIEEENVELINWHNNSSELVSMKKVCANAYGQYLRSRPRASNDSVRRSKELILKEIGVHPAFIKSRKDKSSGSKNSYLSDTYLESSNRLSFLEQVRNYHPQGTVFELGQKSDAEVCAIMRKKRGAHDDIVKAYRQKVEKGKADEEKSNTMEKNVKLAESNADEIDEAFKEVITSKKRKLSTSYNAHQYELELQADNEEGQKVRHRLKKWDRKKKKMVGVEEKSVRKIRTESGVWIPATYRRGIYEQWKVKSKVDDADEADSDKEEGDAPQNFPKKRAKGTKKKGGRGRNELKRPEQILKSREIKMKQEMRKKGKRKGKKKK